MYLVLFIVLLERTLIILFPLLESLESWFFSCTFMYFWKVFASCYLVDIGWSFFFDFGILDLGNLIDTCDSYLHTYVEYIVSFADVVTQTWAGCRCGASPWAVCLTSSSPWTPPPTSQSTAGWWPISESRCWGCSAASHSPKLTPMSNLWSWWC